jgi:hypothetical protein
MIYSKTNKFHHVKFNSRNFKKLENWIPSDDDIFYHHFYDDLLFSIKIKDAIEDQHWNHLKKNKNAKLLHENCGETFNYNFVNELVEVINQKEINPEQIYILVMDNVHKEFVINGLEKNNIFGVNVEPYNYLLKNIQLENSILESNKKFSTLSRNYRPWRLRLFYHLLEKNLISDFNYSFYNIHPYEKKMFSLMDMIDDFKKFSLPVTDKFLSWLYSVPYKINDTDNVYNKWADVTYSAIAMSDIHLTIETHFDPFLNNNSEDVYDRNFAPSSITEKAYKPIACKKPFIIFSTPYFLEDLKKLGYKTFNGYIDESYDLEVDNSKRLDLIVSEIDRILKLPANEYKKLLKDINEICEHNYKILERDKNSPVPIFLRDLVNA